MFKKLKDKLAEEVKSSPQRIQQFAQAAQAAVTSASSSISDITNNDLFSIGDNENNPNSAVKQKAKSQNENRQFQDISLEQEKPTPSSTDLLNYTAGHENMENQRQRRLSNSSFASDISFRLPSYESPSMYHLQSDMDISASEAEERGFSSNTVSLDRVTKEQLYSAYRKTQERYTKYRNQYADLARHYKLLERENAKARSVLVETQDKALRRISELKEQSLLEQSAKAHLEKALRVEIDERNMKIESLETKVKILLDNKHLNNSGDDNMSIPKSTNDTENSTNLINLIEAEKEQITLSEVQVLNDKIEKLEQLLTKYKESLKSTKERNSQITTELKILNSELEEKCKAIEELSKVVTQLDEAKQQIQFLTDANEDLNNKIKSQDFAEIKENSTLKIDLQKAQNEIIELQTKIEIFTKREEENAISLAENKLSIHKELESKEAEIKSLKDSIADARKEVQSLNIVVSDYKNHVSALEEEKNKLDYTLSELTVAKSKITTLENQIKELSEKCQYLEQSKIKLTEENKCMQLQMKQEAAEKLAIKDRNAYLENRNQQLSEENTKKSSQISTLETEIKILQENEKGSIDDSEKLKVTEEIKSWKLKYEAKEKEIQEEREELGKLQSEIEKLLANHELIQDHNMQLNKVISQMKTKQTEMQQKISYGKKTNKNIIDICQNVLKELIFLKEKCRGMYLDVNRLKKEHLELGHSALENLNYVFLQYSDEKRSRERWKEMFEKACSENKTLEQERHDICDKYKIEEDNMQKKIQVLTDTIQQYEKNLIEVNEKNLKLNSYVEENVRLAKLLEENQISIESLQTSYTDVYKQHETALKIIEKSKEENNVLLKNIKDLEKANLTLEGNIRNLKKELDDAKNTIIIFEENNKKITEENISLMSQYENITKCFETLDTEMIELKKSHCELETEKDRLSSVISSLDKETPSYSSETIKEKQLELKSLQEENKLLKNDNDELCVKINNITKEVKSLKDNEAVLSKANHDLSQKLNTVNIELDSNREKIKDIEAADAKLNEKNSELSVKVNNLNSELNVLKDQYKEIIQENNSLECTNSDLSKQLNTLYLDMTSFTCKNKELEQDNIVLKNNNSELTHDLEILKVKYKEMEEITKTLHNTYNDLTQKVEIESKTPSKDHDSLKEENRRLKSDIEGLQSYLSKISKENSQLNDKLREMIASSENCVGKCDTDDMITLKDQIQTLDAKITELNRENILLAEENMELKDQLHSQNYTNNHDAAVKNPDIEKKYNSLLSSKKNLEQKLDELEQVNKSLNINVQQNQQNNEKLRFSNQKLETRLDEALVSLRHLHALKENTELEYLRNILYEYLTGGGNHSLTLAKVIAAVVKFDDTQTKAILQKEKERQGFLRQLGLL